MSIKGMTVAVQYIAEMLVACIPILNKLGLDL